MKYFWEITCRLDKLKKIYRARTPKLLRFILEPILFTLSLPFQLVILSAAMVIVLIGLGVINTIEAWKEFK